MRIDPRSVVRAVAAALCTVPAMVTHAQGLSTDCAAFVSWLEERLPRTGAIRLVYDTTNSSLVSAVDLETGAFFYAYLGTFGGRDPKGVQYHGRVDGTTVAPPQRPMRGRFPVTMNSELPGIVLFSLRDFPRACAGAERLADGGWRVDYDFPNGSPLWNPDDEEATRFFGVKRVTYWIDASARVTHYRHPDAPELLVPRYDPRGPDVLPASPGWGGFTLRSVEFEPGGNRAWFTPEAARAFAVAAGAIEAPPPPPTPEQLKEAERDLAKRGVLHTDRSSRTGVLLAVTGLVLLIIGAAAWYRHRS